MGALLSQLEEQNEKFEKRLWTIERQVAFLSKMYEEMNKRKDRSNAELKQASPQPLSFKGLAREKAFFYRTPSGVNCPVIYVSTVEKWLKIMGLDNLIGE